KVLPAAARTIPATSALMSVRLVFIIWDSFYFGLETAERRVGWLDWNRLTDLARSQNFKPVEKGQGYFLTIFSHRHGIRGNKLPPDSNCPGNNKERGAWDLELLVANAGTTHGTSNAPCNLQHFRTSMIFISYHSSTDFTSVPVTASMPST